MRGPAFLVHQPSLILTLAGIELQYSNQTYGSLALANYESGVADIKLHSPGKVILSGSSVVASGSL